MEYFMKYSRWISNPATENANACQPDPARPRSAGSASCARYQSKECVEDTAALHNDNENPSVADETTRRYPMESGGASTKAPLLLKAPGEAAAEDEEAAATEEVDAAAATEEAEAEAEAKQE